MALFRTEHSFTQVSATLWWVCYRVHCCTKRLMRWLVQSQGHLHQCDDETDPIESQTNSDFLLAFNFSVGEKYPFFQFQIYDEEIVQLYLGRKKQSLYQWPRLLGLETRSFSVHSVHGLNNVIKISWPRVWLQTAVLNAHLALKQS